LAVVPDFKVSGQRTHNRLLPEDDYCCRCGKPMDDKGECVKATGVVGALLFQRNYSQDPRPLRRADES